MTNFCSLFAHSVWKTIQKVSFYNISASVCYVTKFHHIVVKWDIYGWFSNTLLVCVWNVAQSISINWSKLVKNSSQQVDLQGKPHPNGNFLSCAKIPDPQEVLILSVKAANSMFLVFLIPPPQVWRKPDAFHWKVTKNRATGISIFTVNHIVK